jgi:hypothetical protein
MVTNTAMTLLNKYIDAVTRREVYKVTVLKEVFWQSSKAANVRATGGMTEADQATVFISRLRVANYLDPIAWNNLVVKGIWWTFQSGDFVIKGSVDIASYSISELKAMYSDMLAINSVDYFDAGRVNMHHWEIGAK